MCVPYPQAVSAIDWVEFFKYFEYWEVEVPVLLSLVCLALALSISPMIILEQWVAIAATCTLGLFVIGFVCPAGLSVLL